MKNNWKIFWQTLAVSWLGLGILALLLEFWRAGWFDFLIPVWFIFSVAGLAGLIYLIKK